ncbi:MAG: ABC transporter permease [Hoeflea sp.]|uniref:ABC transporter permease n=1 Tax=Hoeflea sp. TaxID=1940281 RepID=UPI0032EC2B32
MDMKNTSVVSTVFATHFRVVSALISREMVTRFGNNPGGYLWALLDPIANITFLTLIFSAIARNPPLGTSFPMFFATGFIAFHYYRSIENYVSAGIKSNKTLLSYPNVAPVDVIIARYVLQLATTTAIALVVLGFLMQVIRNPPVINFFPLVEAAFLASIMALGIAMANNVLFIKYRIYERLYAVVNRPLYLISGIFFLPDAIPHPFRELLLINPGIHVVMLFRQGFYPEYRAIGLDLPYVYTWVIVVFFSGMLIFRTNAATMRSN